MEIKTVQSDRESWRAHYPFASHWFDLPDGPMHCLDEGPKGETLLFVHGNPTWSFHWRNLILSLRDRFRCVAPDHLGCGLSAKPRRLIRLEEHIENLVKLVERADLHRITLVAQDWGGAIGLGAMLRVPDRLEQIVLLNTGAFPPPFIPWRIRICRTPLLGRLAMQGMNLFSRSALRMTLTRRKQLPAEIADGYLAPYDSWHHRRAVFGFVQDIPSSPRHPTWKILAQLESELPSLANRPAALIWGMQDWCFGPDCLERFVTAWPHADVHRLEDAGHWVLEDATEDVVPIVREFLTKDESSEKILR